MRKYLLALVALLALAFAVNTVPAQAATTRLAPCNQHWPLHPGTRTVRGSCGQRVKNLQWELGGHRPYAMKQAKPTFKWKPNGAYGARTKTAVLAMKFRLGYPKAGQCGYKHTLLVPTVTPWFLKLMANREKRSTCWIGLAADRVKGAVTPGVSTVALRIKALELSQLGVHESPTNSNRGPCISTIIGCSKFPSAWGPYQSSTGAYGLAWCASFQDWALKRITGHGFGSANDAYVPTIAEHERAVGGMAAKPKFGSFVAFLTNRYELSTSYHIGFVVKVTASGVQTIEGNATSPYGGVVKEVWRPYFAYKMVYLDHRGVA